jgi:signal transduction histidine kinase
VPPPKPTAAEPLLRRLLRPSDAWSDVLDLGSSCCLPLMAEGRWIGGVLLPMSAEAAEPVADLLVEIAPTLGFFLAASLRHTEANQLAERLADVNQALSEHQQSLAQAEALAAIGEMAAGAAHEMNNPLAVIAGRSQLLGERLEDPEQREMARLVARKAQDISDIATELMEFARPEAPRPGAVDVPSLLASAREAYQAGAPAGRPASGPAATVDVEADRCPAAWADARQIGEVLVELIRNAAAAADGPVHVRLTAAAEPREERAEPPSLTIRVIDDGPGMDTATACAAFTPFFSRRPAGRGRGMGLARARRAVQANRGEIRIDSRPGRGTTVTIELPRADSETERHE